MKKLTKSLSALSEVTGPIPACSFCVPVSMCRNDPVLMMKVRVTIQWESRVKELMLGGCWRVGVALVCRLIIASIPVAAAGDLWNVSFFMEPGVSQVQSPSLVSDFGFYTVDCVMEVVNAGSSVKTVDLGDGDAFERIPEDVGGFGTVDGTSLLMQPAMGPAKHMTGILMVDEPQDSHGKPFVLVLPEVSVYDPCQTVLSQWADVLLKQTLRSFTES